MTKANGTRLVDKMKMKIIFVGIHGYQLPYSRVRCYHFAEMLRLRGVKTEVVSYQEHFNPGCDPIEMLNLTDKKKLRLNLMALGRLCKEKNSLFYIQKVHYHSAAPFFLSRVGVNKCILDYDDWDVDRSPLFKNKYLNLFFFGCDGAAQITAHVASKALGCVASSHSLYQFLSQYNKNVSYVPTGVDSEHFQPCRNSTAHKLTFVWTGQVWGKVIFENILYLLDCFSEVSSHYEGVRFKIIGGGEWMPKVKDYIALHNPCQDIKVIDWVAPLEMPAHLSDADIGLLPLISDTKNELWMKSKSPTKLFEYMAMGLPTIASRIGEAEFIIENGRDGFLTDTREDFVDKMKALLRDTELRIRMGRLAREKVVREYSLQVLGDRLFEFVSTWL